MVARHEGASYGSDAFLIADGVLPAHTQEIAEVTTTRVDPEVYVPPMPGIAAHRAVGTVRDRALYFDSMSRKVVVGSAATVSPSTSTSSSWTAPAAPTSRSPASPGGHQDQLRAVPAALDLLLGVLGDRSLAAKALIFAVKGEDLMFLDKPNAKLDDVMRAKYARLGLPATPFDSARFFAPPRPGDQTGRPTSRAAPAASTRSGGRCSSSANRNSCPSCSPTRRTTATSTRSWCTRSPPSCAARQSRPAPTARSRSMAPASPRTPS
ncbi:hypothetical protein [Tessaracoccus coleopterorum]|uniref:hypothetical protein n=1 Tax=Tessaracoccus coleopterorum TaxID=2714950 RepID=UPI0018D332B1|nr:hypothetical protein [Tessaracoccus coleopterorum]